MPENISNIIVLPVLVFVGILMLSIAAKVLRNKYAPVKTVKAVVVDKHKVETFSKYAGNGKREKYVVVFQAEGKKLSFYVSAFSYGGYRLNETGTLKYKGNQLVDFR